MSFPGWMLRTSYPKSNCQNRHKTSPTQNYGWKIHPTWKSRATYGDAHARSSRSTPPKCKKRKIRFDFPFIHINSRIAKQHFSGTAALCECAGERERFAWGASCQRLQIRRYPHLCHNCQSSVLGVTICMVCQAVFRIRQIDNFRTNDCIWIFLLLNLQTLERQE